MKTIFEKKSTIKFYIFLIFSNIFLFFIYLNVSLNFKNNNQEHMNLIKKIDKINLYKKENENQKNIELFFKEYKFKDNFSIKIDKNSKFIISNNGKIENSKINDLLNEIINNNYYIEKFEFKNINEEENNIMIEVQYVENN